ncbi:hypothetical protein I4U23_015995 [Adineta vaga]|nr:hypothetical protein I4U23_015995 [Adineta vaga]
MNISTNITTYSSILTKIIGIVPLYINFVTIIFGTIGGICNIITYTAPRLRNNSSVFYLLCSTIFEIFSILFIVPTRIALDNFGNNLERQSIIFCKIRYYISITFPMLVTYYILFAIIDRYFSTSKNIYIRSLSHLKLARRLSIILFVLGILGSLHVLIFYNINNRTCQVSPGSIYTIYFAIYLICIVSLVPHLLMLIFIFLILRNVKQTRQRTMPMLTRTKRSESQLIMMIIVQIFISSVLVLLRLGSYTYSTLTSGNLNKTTHEKVIEDFCIRLGFALYYFSFATSFYFSTLARKYFREVFFKRIRKLYRRFQRLVLFN